MEVDDAKSVARAYFAAILGGDGDLGPMGDAGGALSAYVRSFAAPSFICTLVPIPPNPSLTFDGPDGLVQAWTEWSGSFESIHGKAEELFESDDALVLFVEQIAITKHGGVEVRQPSAMVWVFAEGKLTRIELHLDRDAALKAGGL